MSLDREGGGDDLRRRLQGQNRPADCTRTIDRNHWKRSVLVLQCTTPVHRGDTW